MRQNTDYIRERAAYVVLLVLALLLRLANLGDSPLNHQEAIRAWSAWQLVQGGVPQTWDDPATLLTTAGIFLAFGSNDVLARLAPALAGTVLVALTWWLRPLLGRTGAVGAAVVLALSPFAVFLSRSLTGHAVFMAVSLLFTVSLFRLRNGAHSAGIVTLVALVLLLNSGPLGVSFLLLVAAYLALDWVTQPRGQAIIHWLFPFRGHWPNTMACSGLIIVAFIAIGSGWFINWQGLGFPSLTDWLRLFDFTPEGLAWYHLPALLMAYDPLTVLLGLTSCALATISWRTSKGTASAAPKSSLDDTRVSPNDPLNMALQHETVHFHRFTYWWLGGGLGWLLVAGTRQPEHLALVMVPLALLAGKEGARLVGSLTRRDWQWAGWMVVTSLPLAGLAYLALGWFSKPEVGVQGYQWLAIEIALVSTLAALGWGIWWGGRKIALPLAVVALTYLALFQVHSLVSVNYRPTAAEWLRGPVAVGDMRQVTQMALQALLGLKGQGEVVVEHSLADSLGWYLRGYKNVVWAEIPTPNTIFLVRSGRADQEIPGFTRSIWGLEQRWKPPSLNLEKLWRWWIYRETFGEIQNGFYTVYERTEGRQ